MTGRCIECLAARHDGSVPRPDSTNEGVDLVLARCAAAAVEADDVAVAQLVRLMQPAVWQLCTALGSVGETEDLVQETYLRALKALPNFRDAAPGEAAAAVDR